MSHAATNWAIQRRGLKPTTKIVLWHLCDRFNPDFGCFPTQERLAHDCEIGRATLNRHLDELEARRLIKRVRIVDTKTGQQRPTRYLLGFEFDDRGGARVSRPSRDGDVSSDSDGAAPPSTPEEISSASQNTAKAPCLDLGHGSHAATSYGDEGKTPSGPATPCPKTGQGEQRRPVSHFGQNPCLKNGDSRVSKWDTNPVREPLSKPVKKEEDARARETGFDDFFGKLITALGIDPDGPLPGWWQGWPPREHVRRWIGDLGLTEIEILEVATASRQEHPAPPDGPKALDRVMQRAARRMADEKSRGRRKAQKQAKQKRQPIADMPAFYADWVNSEKYLPSSAINNSMRDQMLARGLVTTQQLRERGVQ
ncbi:helix-turn-helix domain-containing protein [Thalassobacter stenotrophicus]|uniref:helix-turn-helix domain-containing protein n=1 Tax=Thalassobacter stenotrophicus TaxID=266809 RepID=UPI0022A99E51|nr:helix-turn-helix domain-containing protein [Thalassobacter stenotrophicus]UYP68553.1 helix-turn-helix domain-containing protein [Thalassobacter stenotrophicus]